MSFRLENALIGTPGLNTIRSNSVLGLSWWGLAIHDLALRTAIELANLEKSGLRDFWPVMPSLSGIDTVSRKG